MQYASLFKGLIITGLLLAMPSGVSGQTLSIRPALIDASSAVEEALQHRQSQASTVIEGKGRTLEIEYTSTEPLDVFMVPLQNDETFVPTDYLHFTLPLTEKGTVQIDLTVSAGWSGRNTKWLVQLLSESEETGAAFTDLRFSDEGPSIGTIVAKHIFTKEPYTPSSYHALRGYRFLGNSFTVWLGSLTVLLAIVSIAVAPKKRKRSVALGILFIGSMLYATRFGVDLSRYSIEHLGEYADGTYDEAGSVHTLAAVIRSVAGQEPMHRTVYVCRDGTNFKEKLLRYFVYPVRVSANETLIPVADFAVVMNKYKWSTSVTLSREQSTTVLTCGSLKRRAEKITTLQDGSVLFRLLPDAPAS